LTHDLFPWSDAAPPGRGALLLGGVNYEEARNPAQPEGPRFALRAPRGRSFAYLPGTKEEVLAIGRQLGSRSTVVLGSEASEARLRRASRGKRILHLATHGFVRTDLLRGLLRPQQGAPWLGADAERQLAAGHDPMNLSGLALAGATSRHGGGGDDGILTALDASYLDLDGVELVVLSACQTARGTAESGEGVLGLVRGFQMAGASQVIGSLWKVDDEATVALMTRFYELWSPQRTAPGDPPASRSQGGHRLEAAAALQAAQAAVRSQPKWTHPSYWAAWVLWGAADGGDR